MHGTSPPKKNHRQSACDKRNKDILFYPHKKDDSTAL